MKRSDFSWEKDVVEKSIGFDLLWDLEGRLDDTIAMLQKIPSEYPDYVDFKIVVDRNYSDCSIQLYGYRLETDEEFQRRIDMQEIALKRHKEKKKKTEEEERKEYERLKRKFGDDKT